MGVARCCSGPRALFTMSKLRVGIIGFGSLGNFLYDELNKRQDYEIVFVWNRTLDRIKDIVPDELILENLTECNKSNPDLIVEVAHPSVTVEYGTLLVNTANYLIGSPTALSDPNIYQSILSASESHHSVYIATGALWGAQDIKKMADRGTLQGLRVTMKKHPSMLKVVGSLAEKNNLVSDTAVTLYEGSVRGLCPLAPNNVNTMATAAILAHNLGFDGVIGCLVSDPSLDRHIVEIEVFGPGSTDNRFSVHTIRSNPAPLGAVTGKQTYISFLSSLLAAKDHEKGIHVC